MINVIEKKSERKASNISVVEFSACANNEQFARITVAAFIALLNPTLEEMSDVKTAVSEAVTNAIIHGYENKGLVEDRIRMSCQIVGDVLEVEIKDWGVGIANIKQAMEPLFTTKPELERSGMGFAFMEAFMDDLQVTSSLGQGTTVFMKKKLGTEHWLPVEEGEQ